MPRTTTTGLESSTSTAAALSAVQWAAGAGSADVITAAYTPALKALSDGLICRVRLSATNVSTTPTFEPDGLGAHTITKDFGEALDPGDLPDEALLSYKLSTTTWVLVNPNAHFREPTGDWAIAGGVADAITATYVPPTGTLVDGQILRVRATAANATTTPTFSPDTKTARIIKKIGGQALGIGDIYGADHELFLQYHDNATPWYELLNPSAVSAAANGDTYKRLTADGATFANDTAVHGLGLKVTLPIGDHAFRGRLHTTRAAGTTSHSTNLLFGGSATYTVRGRAVSRGGDANALAAISGLAIDVLTAQVVKGPSTSATEDVDVFIEGTFKVTVAGTVEPQFQYDVAPGGVTTPKDGSYLETRKVTNPTGTWT